MVIPRIERSDQSRDESSVVNLSSVRTKRLFSKIKGLGFGLLSTDVSRSIIKSPLTLLDAPRGEIKLKDPALLLILDLVGQSKGVLYLSLQAPRDEIIAKMVLALSGVNETMVKKGALVGDSQVAFEKACSIIYNSNLHVGEGEVSGNFWAKVQELKEKSLIDVVIIDDLHSLGFKMSKGEKGVSQQDLLEHFNEMALNSGLPVVLISRTL